MCVGGGWGGGGVGGSVGESEISVPPAHTCSYGPRGVPSSASADRRHIQSFPYWGRLRGCSDLMWDLSWVLQHGGGGEPAT